MSTRKHKRDVTAADKRRRADAIMALRVQEDIRKQKQVSANTPSRSTGTVGTHTVPMPVVEPGLLGRGCKVVDASVGAVALVGPNLGTERWRHPRAYLGLFINPARGSR